MLLSVPDFFSVEWSGVPERIAEHLGQKIALHLGFVEFREAARSLQIGPFHEHGVGGLQLVLVEPLVFGRVLQKTRQDEAVRLGLTQRDRGIDGEEGFLSHFHKVVRAAEAACRRVPRPDLGSAETDPHSMPRFPVLSSPCAKNALVRSGRPVNGLLFYTSLH